MCQVTSLGRCPEKDSPHLPFAPRSAAGSLWLQQEVMESHGAGSAQSSGLGVGRGSSEQRFQADCKHEWQSHKQRQALQTAATAPGNFCSWLCSLLVCPSVNRQCPGKPKVTWETGYFGVSLGIQVFRNPQTWVSADWRHNCSLQYCLIMDPTEFYLYLCYCNVFCLTLSWLVKV